jgi:hypothetical protein
VQQLLLRTAGLTILFEAVTMMFRFGFNLQSTRDTASLISPITFGVRIHHGYIGVLLLLSGVVLFRSESILWRWIICVGAALLLSDLIHHFLVLRLITGHSLFDLFYPDNGMAP